jgi:hypothetical protein
MNPAGKKTLLLSLLVCGMTVSAVMAPSAWGKEAPPVASVSKERVISPYRPASVTESAKNYYQAVWGVDNLFVKYTASGSLIRFSYRVTDPARAKMLGDEHATPYLYGQRSHALLHIPDLENVGKLRQSDEKGVMQAGKEYWMTFSNKGSLVRTGDRVNVIIGSFHADGLLVE